MEEDDVIRWFPILFPILFVGIWLAVTTILGLMIGWFNLQQWYADDGNEEPLLTLRGQSGSMGFGVALSGILRLRAYPSGLGIKVWRIFGPFQKPLRIPWSEIDVEPSRSFFEPMAKLNLASNGTLKISARSWSRLIEAAKTAVPGPLPDALSVSGSSTALAMAVQWFAITILAGTFFYLSSRTETEPLSPIFCFAFPGIFFGIAQLIRFARS